MIEMGIVAVLTTVGLMIIGVPYAILLGTITAILNLIPYIGILVAGCISIVVALTNSTEVSVVVGVIVVNAVVQLFDNNFLIPKIVASKVKINALVSIVAVFVGGALAGVIGMFLAIPLSAMLKVIFDRINGLEPWGILMGDDMPKTYEWGKIKLPALSAGDNDPYEDNKETIPVKDTKAERVAKKTNNDDGEPAERKRSRNRRRRNPNRDNKPGNKEGGEKNPPPAE